MYKLLLVEDEDEVRRGIASIIDWEKCGFTLCGMAAGALEAMEFCKTEQPDVVMTDIFMPYMDGLEMIARLNEMYPMMRYIIVSGHDDFRYVREALQYRVLDYLLKPLAADGTTQALLQAKKALDNALDRRRNLNRLRHLAEENHLLMDRFSLMELLSNGGESVADPAYAQQFSELFPAFLALIALDRTEENDRAMQKAFAGRTDLRDAAILDIMQGEEGRLCIRFRGHYLALLHGTQDKAIEKTERMYERMRYYHGLSCVAVVSEIIYTPDGAPDAYLDALYRAERQKRLPARNLYISPPSAAVGGFLTAQIAHDITALLREGKGDEAAAYCVTLADDALERQASMAETEFLRGAVMTAILAAASQIRVPGSEVYAAFDSIRPTRQLDFAEEMRVLGLLAKTLCERPAEDDAQGDRALVERILRYIDARFTDKDLSVEQVCEAFYISATKLSLLFKREMGTSFLQYVLDLRIQSAQRMLLETQEKISKIALDNGFGDAGYFSYCFKQRCGVTPKDFRREAAT
jgi:two-component system response regulator YesN